MDQQNQTAFPNPNEPIQSPVNPNIYQNNLTDSNSRKFGPIIVITIIILIIIAVGIYLFSSQISANSTVQNNIAVEQTTPMTTPAIIPDQTITPEVITPISNTDDGIDSLQKDLEMSIDGIEEQSI